MTGFGRLEDADAIPRPASGGGAVATGMAGVHPLAFVSGTDARRGASKRLSDATCAAATIAGTKPMASVTMIARNTQSGTPNSGSTVSTLSLIHI